MHHALKSLGRPPDETKRDAIVSAASDAFFEHGYSATSIEEIARRANVSKVTIYNRFGDKQTLFAASITAQCAGMRASLDTDVSQPVDLRDHLIRYGMVMLGFLGRPELVRFENMLGGEMERHPELGELFLNCGPRPMMRELTSVLEAAAARGDIIVADPAAAAAMLGGMMKGFADLERRFAQRPMSDFISPERVAYAVDSFLKAHRPD